MVSKLIGMVGNTMRIVGQPLSRARLHSTEAVVSKVAQQAIAETKGRVPYYRKLELKSKLSVEEFKQRMGVRTLEEFKNSSSIQYLYKGDAKAVESAYHAEIASIEGAYRDYLEGATPARML